MFGNEQAVSRDGHDLTRTHADKGNRIPEDALACFLLIGHRKEKENVRSDGPRLELLKDRHPQVLETEELFHPQYPHYELQTLF